MKQYRSFLLLISIFMLSLWLTLPTQVMATYGYQSVPPTPSPTPGLTSDTNNFSLIIGAVVIVVVILVGVLFRPKK
ncbi:MAG: hypothetical protein U9Q82_14965 [Chloroflexota bacterium]|nr:hypothetical protein [Chloroflexota bacterium]